MQHDTRRSGFFCSISKNTYIDINWKMFNHNPQPPPTLSDSQTEQIASILANLCISLPFPCNTMYGLPIVKKKGSHTGFVHIVHITHAVSRPRIAAQTQSVWNSNNQCTRCNLFRKETALFAWREILSVLKGTSFAWQTFSRRWGDTSAAANKGMEGMGLYPAAH